MWAFSMVLACSRHMFVLPVLSMDQQAWTAAHVAAFEFFDGAPARLVPDNLRTGVVRADLYDPQLNRSYGELAEHYGVLIDPARSNKPRDKPRVERPMPYIRDSFWRGRQFDSLSAMQTAAVRWSLEVAGRRARRALDGAAPAAVFAAVEQPTVIGLPRAPFELAGGSRPKVGPDIEVGKTLYSVPWRLIGQRVDARATPTTVQVFHDGQLVKTHIAKPRGKQTDMTDYPPEKIAFHMRTPTGCREQAAEIGPACVRGRRAARGQRPVPAARRAGSARAGPGTARPGWKRPARWRCRWVTRPTAPSRASWSPAPNTNPPPGPPVTAAPASAD